MVAVKDTKNTKNTSMISTFAIVSMMVVTACSAACDPKDILPIPSIEVVQPQNESIVTTPVYFELEAKNWDIEPPTVRRDGAGYFVLILEDGCEEAGRLMSFEQTYVHLADGALTSWISLSPGVYSVCAQIADGNHRATELKKVVSFEVVE